MYGSTLEETCYYTYVKTLTMCATKKESERTLRSKDVLMLHRLAMMNVPIGWERMSVHWVPCRGGQE